MDHRELDEDLQNLFTAQVIGRSLNGFARPSWRTLDCEISLDHTANRPTTSACSRYFAILSDMMWTSFLSV
jgi:hypothetical protein